MLVESAEALRLLLRATKRFTVREYLGGVHINTI